MARPVAERMHRWASGLEDEDLTPAMRVDFGVDSVVHACALAKAVQAGATLKELDHALGHGRRLSALVRKYVPSMLVGFRTSYDEMEGRT